MAGTGFSYRITATNNPTGFGATGLPQGLGFMYYNYRSGYISGTPTVAGVFHVVLRATNAGGSGSANLTLTVAAPPPPVITSAASASVMVGKAFNYYITATNNPTSYSVTGLPKGLNYNRRCYSEYEGPYSYFYCTPPLISGNPIAGGVFPITLKATNAGGTGTATLILTVAPLPKPVITSPTSVSAMVGKSFNYYITATNSPTSFGATGLPQGLNFYSNCQYTGNISYYYYCTGRISGGPTVAGVFPITLKATNAGGTGTAALTLAVSAGNSH